MKEQTTSVIMSALLQQRSLEPSQLYARLPSNVPPTVKRYIIHRYTTITHQVRRPVSPGLELESPIVLPFPTPQAPRQLRLFPVRSRYKTPVVRPSSQRLLIRPVGPQAAPPAPSRSVNPQAIPPLPPRAVDPQAPHPVQLLPVAHRAASLLSLRSRLSTQAVLSQPRRVETRTIDPQASPPHPVNPQAVPPRLMNPQALPRIRVLRLRVQSTRSVNSQAVQPRPQAVPPQPVVPQAIPSRPIDPQAIPLRPVDPHAVPPRPVDPRAVPPRPVNPQAVPPCPMDPQAVPPPLPPRPVNPLAVPLRPVVPQAVPSRPVDPQAVPPPLPPRQQLRFRVLRLRLIPSPQPPPESQ